MNWRRWGIFLVVLGLGGCAAGGGRISEETPQVGQREAELVAQKGQPQEVKPLPGGGKIYVYTRYRLDQVAAMGGGAWGKPDEWYFWLNDQGVITRVAHYPYGKKKFLFPSEEPPTPAAAPRTVDRPTEGKPLAAASPPPVSTPAISRENRDDQGKPSGASAAVPGAPPEGAKPPAPGATAVSGQADMKAATRLELNLTREEVARLLGVPERTEGFRVKGRAVIIWFYQLADPKGRRVLTPVAFENGRVSGWGEPHYRQLLREAVESKP